MPTDVFRAGLYRGSINLWVEDKISREYLSAIWNDPDIAFFIAGGNDGVRAVVTNAEQDGYHNVFGLIDRDFRLSTRDDWQNPRKNFRTFILPVHEIENYLLDPPALASSRLNTLKKSADQIQAHLASAASRLTWWAACRSVVAMLRQRFRDDFMTDPKCGKVTDEMTAANHICKSDWFRGFEERSTGITEPDIRQHLIEAHEVAEAQVADGSWRIEFAGKEIFRDVGSRICDRTARTELPAPRSKPVEFDIDLAKDIAKWQTDHKKVPSDLTDLRSALRARIARTPPQDGSSHSQT